GTVDADALGVFAEVSAAGEAVAAMTTDDVAFAGDDVADVEVVDIGAGGDDSADEFVADMHGDGDGFLGPGVPVVDVHIGSADAGAEDFDHDVVDAVFGERDIFEPKADFAFAFDEGAHGFHGLALLAG